MMLLLSFIAGAVIGAVVVGLVQAGKLTDLEAAIYDLMMKWEVRALRAREGSLLIQEFMQDLDDLLHEGETHDPPA